MQYVYWLALFILSFLSFGLSTFHSGIFWDDFTILGVPIADVITNFYECGRPQLGYFHSFFRLFPEPIIVYKIAAFAFRFLSVIFLYLILSKTKIVEKKLQRLTVLVFALLPINQVGAESIVLSQYHASLAFLFAGFYLWLKLEKNRNLLVAYLVIPLLFIFSFTIEACAALLAIIMPAYLFYRSKIDQTKFIELLKKNSLYLLLPYAYILFQLLFLKPYGVCVGNNIMSLSNILLIPKSLAHAFLAPLAFTPYWTFKRFDSLLLLMPSLLSVAILFFSKDYWMPTALNKLRPLKQNRLFLLICFGALLVIVATVPYALVGKPPKFYGWFSRFQSHLGLGLSLMIAPAVVLFIRNNTARLICALLIVAYFVATNIGMRTVFYRDHLKQETLVVLFKSDPLVFKGQRFNVVDESTEFDALRRAYNFYEYTGLFNRAFGDERRIAYNSEYEKQNINSVINSVYPGLFNITDLPKEYLSLPEYTIYLNKEKEMGLSESFVYMFGLNSAKRKAKTQGWISINVQPSEE